MLKRSLSIGARLLAALSVFALTASLGHSKGGGEDGYGSCSHGCGHSGSYGSAGRHGKKGLRRLRQADADGYGKVTLEEFTTRRERRFVELDADSDGELSLEELFKPMQAGADHKVRRIMTRYDADGDGKITKDEFAKPARRRFATRDFNGDGTISDDELPTSRGTAVMLQPSQARPANKLIPRDRAKARSTAAGTVDVMAKTTTVHAALRTCWNTVAKSSRVTTATTMASSTLQKPERRAASAAITTSIAVCMSSIPTRMFQSRRTNSWQRRKSTFP